MCTGIEKKTSDEAKALRELGLKDEHAYAILAAVRVTDENAKPVNLVKLRNPWGFFEWKGEWSDSSDRWTEKMKIEVAYDPKPRDGIFWMSFEEMQKYFPRI